VCPPVHNVCVTADARDEMSRTPLHYAALNGPLEDVRALLRGGADVAATDEQGFTAPHFACQQNRPDVAEVLLDAEAPVDPVDQWGNTPLFRAVSNAKGDPRIVHRLVRAGADPDKENASGRTPRQLASMIANYDTTGYFDGTGSPQTDGRRSSGHPGVEQACR
jgi:uncharacterized protein